MANETRWTDLMILESIRDCELMGSQAMARALELADLGLISTAGNWSLTATGKAALASRPGDARLTAQSIATLTTARALRG